MNPVDSMLVAGSVSDSSGVYHINVNASKYIVRYSYLGYKTLYRNIDLTIDSELPEVQMSEYNTELTGVEILANKKTFKLANDGLVTDVEHTILAKQTNLKDLLCKIPGIQLKGDNIEVIGRGAPSYYINGREVDDTELDNLSIDQIKSVKLITDAGIRYHSEQRAVIEIKTKQLGEGLAFNVRNNLLQGNHFSQNHLINVSYNHNKIDYFLSYNYQHGKKDADVDILQQTLSDTIWNLTKSSDKTVKNDIHTYTGGVLYHISPESELGLKYIGEYSTKSNLLADSLSMVPNHGTSVSLKNNSCIDQRIATHHLNLYYTNKWNNEWRISASGDYIHKSDHQSGDISEWEREQPESILFYKNKSSWDIFAANLRLSHQNKSNGKLGIGYDFSSTNGTDHIDNVRALNNGKTNNRELKNSVFVTYDYPVKKFSISTGLRYEYVRTDLKESYSDITQYQNYHNILPSIGISYMSQDLQQTLGYSIHTERPPFSVMNDNAIYTDRFTYQKGNIYLKQSITHDINYMLYYKFLLININYTNTQNPLVTAFYSMPGNSSVVVSYMDNFKRLQNLTGMINLQYNIKRWTPSLTLTCMKSFFKYKGIDGSPLRAGRPIIMANWNNNFNLPSDFTLSADYNYGSRGDFQLFDIKSYSSFNISLKKSLLNEKLQLSLDAYDLFNQNKNRAIGRLNDIIMQSIGHEESRRIGFTLTYRFRTEKTINVESAAKTELKRLDIE